MPETRTEVTLVTEGGYPYSGGGVSEWCHQIVRTMPDLGIEVVALTGGVPDKTLYPLPPNVRRLSTIPLWSFRQPGRPPRGRTRARFRAVYADFLAATLAPGGPSREFTQALRALFEYAQQEDLSAALAADDAVLLLADAWRAWPPGTDDPGVSRPKVPPLGDAALVTMWLEHMLRPLGAPVPESRLVHCASNGLAGLVGLAAAWTRGTPLVLSEHGVYLRERYLAYREVAYGWAVKSTLLRLTRALTEAVYQHAEVVAPGNLYNRRWQERGGVAPVLIRTVYNGVDPEEFAPVGPEPEVPTLVFLGRIDPLKDIETLLRAFAIVHREMPEARLRIFGTPAPSRLDYLERCRRLSTELGLDGAATFEGRAEHARDAYAAGQVVVLSSISEGFPYSVLEAMSCGRPTVSTDVGGVAEAVGDAAVVVPPRDPEAFARACLDFLRDPEARARSAAASRARVLEHFTLGRSMTHLRDVYDAVLAGRPAPVAQLPTSVVPA